LTKPLFILTPDGIDLLQNADLHIGFEAKFPISKRRSRALDKWGAEAPPFV